MSYSGIRLLIPNLLIGDWSCIYFKLKNVICYGTTWAQTITNMGVKRFVSDNTTHHERELTIG